MKKYLNFNVKVKYILTNKTVDALYQFNFAK